MKRKSTPLKAIRQFCLFCMNDQASYIKECDDIKCFFYYYRMRKNNSNPRVSALKQIRKFCLDCGEGRKGVKECIYPTCSLYNFRFGKNPARAGMGPEKPVFVKKT